MGSAGTRVTIQWVVGAHVSRVRCHYTASCPQVHCADARGGLLPDSRCRHLGRPVSEEFCSEAACPEHSGGWLVGAWGQVSVPTIYCIMSLVTL